MAFELKAAHLLRQPGSSRREHTFPNSASNLPFAHLRDASGELGVTHA